MWYLGVSSEQNLILLCCIHCCLFLWALLTKRYPFGQIYQGLSNEDFIAVLFRFTYHCFENTLNRGNHGIVQYSFKSDGALEKFLQSLWGQV